MLARAFDWLENPSRDARAVPEMVGRLFLYSQAGQAIPVVCLAAISAYFASRTGWAGPVLIIALHLVGAFALNDLRRRSAAPWHTPEVALAAARQHALLTAIKGWGWVLAFWIWAPVATSAEIAILGAMCVAICTGSAMARACYLPCAFLHISTVSIGYVTAIAAVGAAVAPMVIGGGCAYFIWLAWVTFVVHRDSHKVIALGVKNRELIESLTQAQASETQARHAVEAARGAAERARDDATMAHKAKTEFLAIVSHELRTPLNGILGMASVLNDTELTGPQRDAISTIRGAGEALSLIVDDLLDLTRLESGHSRLERQEIILPRLVESVVQILRLRAWEKRLKLTMDIAPDVPETMLSDPGRLRQILINLAGNAVKFTDRGEVKIVVSLSAGRDRLVRFEVRDTGIGIPNDAIPRLFKPFSQVDQSYTRSYGGTGLGLAIVKRLAEMMDGHVGVESEVGKGSVFWVEVPLLAVSGAERAVDQRVDEPRTDPKTTARETEPLSPLNVLVIDDSTPMRMMLRVVLAAANHTCVEAATGEEGLRALGQHVIDIVLVDLEMPGLDGAATARLIRAMPDHASVPVIALTGHDPLVVQRSGIAAAADVVLTKPIMPEVLFAALQRVAPSTRSGYQPQPEPAMPLSAAG